MELAVRNYFDPYFQAKIGKKQQKNRLFGAVLSYSLGGPEGERTREV